MEFKEYTHIEFNDNFLTFTQENGIKIILSYSKIDFLTESPASHLLAVSIKGHGRFDKTYESRDHLDNDIYKLMNKGRSPKC